MGEEDALANGTAGGEQGYVSISIGASSAAKNSGSAARTILPWDDDGTDSGQLAHTVILCDGPAPDQEQLIPESGIVNFTLAPGAWTVRVEGRLGTELKSIGLTPITVAAGETTKKTVQMSEPVTVTFDPNLFSPADRLVGTFPVSQTIPKDTLVTMPDGAGITNEVPVSGTTLSALYHFGGWCLDPAGTEPVYEPGGQFSVNENITFYVKWNSEYGVGYVHITSPDDTPNRLGYSLMRGRSFVRGANTYDVVQWYLTDPSTFEAAEAKMTLAWGPYDATSTGHMIGTELSEHTTDGIIFETNLYIDGGWGQENRLLEISGGIISDMRVWLSDEVKAEFAGATSTADNDGGSFAMDNGAVLNYLTSNTATYPSCGMLTRNFTLADFGAAKTQLTTAYGPASRAEDYNGPPPLTTEIILQITDYANGVPEWPYMGVRLGAILREIGTFGVGDTRVMSSAEWYLPLD